MNASNQRELNPALIFIAGSWVNKTFRFFTFPEIYLALFFSAG